MSLFSSRKHETTLFTLVFCDLEQEGGGADLELRNALPSCANSFLPLSISLFTLITMVESW